MTFLICLYNFFFCGMCKLTLKELLAISMLVLLFTYFLLQLYCSKHDRDLQLFPRSDEDASSCFVKVCVDASGETDMCFLCLSILGRLSAFAWQEGIPFNLVP